MKNFKHTFDIEILIPHIFLNLDSLLESGSEEFYV